MGEQALDERVTGGEVVEPLVVDGRLAVEGPEEARAARDAGEAVDEGRVPELDRVGVVGVRLDVEATAARTGS